MAKHAFLSCYFNPRFNERHYIPRLVSCRESIFIINHYLKMPPQRKVTLQQIMKLIEQVEKNIDLNLPIYSEERTENQWPKIARILNRIPGESKSSGRWKRYWIEMKSRTRRKAARGKQKFLPHEKRILELCRRVNEEDLSYSDLKMDPEENLVEERLEEDDSDSAAEYLETPGSPASEDNEYTAQHQDPVPTMEDCNSDRSEVHQDDEEVNHHTEKSMKREDDVPNWVRQVEHRRLALEERTTRAIEKMANGIISISGSMDLIGQAMVSLVSSMKMLEESLRPETTEK